MHNLCKNVNYNVMSNRILYYTIVYSNGSLTLEDFNVTKLGILPHCFHICYNCSCLFVISCAEHEQESQFDIFYIVDRI
jgi:hypothetical protein